MVTNEPLARHQVDRRPTSTTMTTTAEITTADIAGISPNANNNTEDKVPAINANTTTKTTTTSSSPSPFIVHYGSGTYDIANFVHKHPGGRNTLAGLHGRRIEQRLRTAPPHSEAAMYLLREYRVDRDGHGRPTLASDDDAAVDDEMDDKDVDMNNNHQAEGQQRLPAAGDEWKSAHQQMDESLEHLVDWSAAMLPQIHKLGANYTEWVNKPVDRPLRLFRHDSIEMLTKTPWWLLPAFWLPCIGWLLNHSIQSQPSAAVGVHLLAGLILWTIVEYTLHRWVFHMDTVGASTTLCTVHFVMHGLHHKVPFDPYRLVFPPVPAVLIASVFYQPMRWLSHCPEVLLAGGLAGYLCYDMIHYYIHYGSPAANGYMYNMKRYHYQHHFVQHDSGFGISSPMWDVAFGTRIWLRKLKYLLRW